VLETYPAIEQTNDAANVSDRMMAIMVRLRQGGLAVKRLGQFRGPRNRSTIDNSEMGRSRQTSEGVLL
jgi:hypothetical protein